MEIKKALTFRASSIGDCLMGKYFLENVHAAYPQARCAIVVSSRGAMIHDLCAAYPWLEIIEVNRHKPLEVLHLLYAWCGSDVVLTQYAGKEGGRFSFSSKIVARMLAKCGALIGFADACLWNRYLYDTILSFARDIAPAVLERKALAALSIPIAVATPALSFSGPASALKRVAVEPGRYAVVHLFAGNPGRGLSPANRHALVNALRGKLSGITLLLSGGTSDRKQAEEAALGVPDVRVIAGDTSLQNMMEFIASAAVVVSVDTGMAHITAQIGKPLVVLASCLGLHWWTVGQYDSEAPIRVFTHIERDGHTFKAYPDCINDIDMQEVARAALISSASH